MHQKTFNAPTKTGKNILALFAPKFTSFGCHIGREFVQSTGAGKVFGLCTGPSSVKHKVANELGDLCGKLWLLGDEEERWISEPVSESDLEKFDRDYPPGTFGKTITADRRIGQGFVRGGLSRPDLLADSCARNNNVVSQRYIVGLYKFLSSVFEQAQPDIVFCYGVAGAPAVAMAELCRAHSIAFAHLVPMRLGNRFMIDSGELSLFEPVARRFRLACEDQTQLHAERSEARQYIASFRQKPETPDYQKFSNARLGAQSALRTTARTLVSLARQVVRPPEGNSADHKLHARRSLFQLETVWRKRLFSRSQFDSIDSIPKQFVYFPLHVDPEASTMVKAPWHTDQISIIEALAKSLPAQLSLVVKEHLPMLGLRPKAFYEQISRMPRVFLLGPEHDGLKLVNKAKLTAVITGTAAWEAMCLGKPALIIGTSPFLAIKEGVVHQPSLALLPEAIVRALSMPPIADEVLEAYIAALFAESFELPTSLYWGKSDERDEHFRIGVAKRIASDLAVRMAEVSRKAEARAG